MKINIFKSLANASITSGTSHAQLSIIVDPDSQSPGVISIIYDTSLVSLIIPSYGTFDTFSEVLQTFLLPCFSEASRKPTNYHLSAERS